VDAGATGGAAVIAGAFEFGADVSGMPMQVEMQRPDRRVQVMFGSHYGSLLMLWLSDPLQIAELGNVLVAAGEQLASELAAVGTDDDQ
jgi:hypothetical protein